MALVRRIPYLMFINYISSKPGFDYRMDLRMRPVLRDRTTFSTGILTRLTAFPNVARLSLLPLPLLCIPLYSTDYYQDYRMASSDGQANRQHSNGNPIQSGGNTRNLNPSPQGMSNGRPNLSNAQIVNYGEYQSGNNPKLR